MNALADSNLKLQTNAIVSDNSHASSFAFSNPSGLAGFAETPLSPAASLPLEGVRNNTDLAATTKNLSCSCCSTPTDKTAKNQSLRELRKETFALRDFSHEIIWRHVAAQREEADRAEAAAETARTAADGFRAEAAALRAEGLPSSIAAAERVERAAKRAEIDAERAERRAARMNAQRKRHRFTACGKVVPSHREVAEVVYHRGNGRASYSGLAVCDSPQCIPCGLRRAEHLRRVIQRLLAEASRQGYDFGMLTFTLQHASTDDLERTLGTLKDALRGMKATRSHKVIRSRYGIAAESHMLEVTHGDNGFHPHTHTVALYDDLAAAAAERAEADRLRSAAVRAASHYAAAADRAAAAADRAGSAPKMAARASDKAIAALGRLRAAEAAAEAAECAAVAAERRAARIPAPALLRRAEALADRAERETERAAEAKATAIELRARVERLSERRRSAPISDDDIVTGSEVIAELVAEAELNDRRVIRAERAAIELRAAAEAAEAAADAAPAADALSDDDARAEMNERWYAGLERADRLRDELYPVYAAELSRRGGYASPEHGLDVAAAGGLENRLAEYVSKFGRMPSGEGETDNRGGLAAEAAKGPTKQGRSHKTRSMIDVLASARESAARARLARSEGRHNDAEAAEKDTGRGAAIWLEYYLGTKGRHFANGLHRIADLLGVDFDALQEAAAVELAAELLAERGPAEIVGELSQDDVTMIARAKLFAVVLDLIETAVDQDDRAEVLRSELDRLRAIAKRIDELRSSDQGPPARDNHEIG